MTPLNFAIGTNIEAVKWLVERGAHLREQEGGTPLNNAVNGHDDDMAIFLLGLNAGPNLLGGYVRLNLPPNAYSHPSTL